MDREKSDVQPNPTDCREIWDSTSNGVLSSEAKGVVFGLLLILILTLSLLSYAPPVRQVRSVHVLLSLIQGLFVLVAGWLVLKGASIPKRVSEIPAGAVFALANRFEFAEKQRVYRYQSERANIKEAFRRMFNFRVRWVVLLIVAGVAFGINRVTREWTVQNADSLLNLFGALALGVSALRGAVGIGRDTTDMLISGPRLPREKPTAAEKQYCERLLSVSATAIDGVIGFTLLVLGFALSLALP